MKSALVLAVLAACGSSPPPAKTPPPPPPADAAPADNLVAECRDYITAMDRLAACPKLPADAAEALKQSSTDFKRDVVNFASSDEARSACSPGLDAIRQSIIQLGC